MAAPGTFRRTLKRHPDHLFMAQMKTPYSLVRKVKATSVPVSFYLFCKQLSYWLNSTDGDCVTAEAMFNIDAAMTSAGKGGFVADSAAVLAFGRKYGLLNGADLNQVSQIIATDGFSDQGNIFTNGASAAVNYRDITELNAAIFEAQASVQIAIAANQLERAAGPGPISFLFGARSDRQTDHCTGLGFYGEAEEMLDKLNSFYASLNPSYQAVKLPSGFAPTTPCQGMFSWNQYFICENQSVVNICDEANIRQPSSILNGTPLVPVSPTPPTPPVYPDAPPAPPLAQAVACILPPNIPYFGCYDKDGNPLWDTSQQPATA
jgi:hypothetical protein